MRRIWPFCRKLLRTTHLIVGCAISLILVLLAVSGALLVYAEEIRMAGRPYVKWDGSRTLPHEQAREIARAHRPDMALQILYHPNHHRPFFEAAYADGDMEFTANARFHPESGAPLPITDPQWLAWVEELHVNLHLGDTGSWLVRWSTVGFVIVLTSGLFLWWPGWKPHLWFSIRKGKLRVWDSHRVAGFLALPALILMALSGIIFAFPVMEDVIHRLTGSEKPQMLEIKANQDEGDVLSTDDEAILQKARDLAPADAFLFYITYPDHLGEPRQVRMQRGFDPMPYGEILRYYFDARTGAHVGSQESGASPAARFLGMTNSSLHFGTIGGESTRVWWVVCSFAVPALAATGIVLSVRRSKRRSVHIQSIDSTSNQ